MSIYNDHNSQLCWESILSECISEFCAAAESVGIDGNALCQNLPRSGQLLTGSRVPVIEKKYANTCSVLFYINSTKSGGTWPFFKFHTFKHGGVTSEFNGIRAVGTNRNQRPIKPAIKVRQNPYLDTNDKDEWRLSNFRINAEKYYAAQPLVGSDWLTRRLKGYASTNLLSRTELRIDGKENIFAPISHHTNGLVGYHRIFTGNRDKKRHYVLAGGLLKGSFILIRSQNEQFHNNIAICEGVATGLSVALVWRGPIYVALTAGNLAPVRETIGNGASVTFFADNDCWKPHVGNTGVRHAKNAAKEQDVVLWPMFSKHSEHELPTDYNDLLMLEGVERLRSQILR